MAFAKNGAALIGGEIVPAAEVKVLRALVNMPRPATVPELAKALDDTFSDASLYSLLGRLAEKRRLASRLDVVVEVHGTKLRRVVWSASPAAIEAMETSPHGLPSLEVQQGTAGSPVEIPG